MKQQTKKGILLLTLFMAGIIVHAREYKGIKGTKTKSVDRRGSWSSTCSPASQSQDLDINNVRTKILNGGDMWWDLNNPKYEVPKYVFCIPF